MKPLSEARVAIVFEWIARFGGGEKVVGEMRKLFPEADIFALVHDPEGLKGTPFEGVPVKTSFIQSLPKATEKYRSYLPLMPLAIEQLDLRAYDLVISASHAVAKGVLTRADQLHVSYIYTPVRYAWDLHLAYLSGSGATQGVKNWLARPILHYLRLWDAVAANRVDAHLTLSHYVARRIWRTYRRPARVVYPPVDVERFRSDLPREDYFVTVSRFVPYKGMDLIAEAFTRTGKPLVIIGDGPERAKVERAAGPNVKLLGHQPDEVVASYLERARGFVFAADEDFGIVPVEAQAAGCPVIAYGKGGALETVVGLPEEDATGVFFDSQTPEALEEAIRTFENNHNEFDAESCRRNAERFSRQRFQKEFRDAIEDLWSKFQFGETLE